jgi:hypothetical protein
MDLISLEAGTSSSVEMDHFLGKSTKQSASGAENRPDAREKGKCDGRRSY